MDIAFKIFQILTSLMPNMCKCSTYICLSNRNNRSVMWDTHANYPIIFMNLMFWITVFVYFIFLALNGFTYFNVKCCFSVLFDACCMLTSLSWRGRYVELKTFDGYERDSSGFGGMSVFWFEACFCQSSLSQSMSTNQLSGCRGLTHKNEKKVIF